MKAMIPDRCYAGIYQATHRRLQSSTALSTCATMGTVSNVGLMAQKAEEYGSHDKTFEIAGDGTVRVVDASGTTLFEHTRRAGRYLADVPDARPADQRLGEAGRHRAPAPRATRRSSGSTAARLRPDADRESAAVPERPRQSGLDIQIMAPVEAIRATLKRVRAGLDTISVTGNVLRDYLTDLFPILELGTSAKMLSIVPLLDGGGLYETAPAARRRSTCSSSCRRTICAGTRSASSWRWPSRSRISA